MDYPFSVLFKEPSFDFADYSLKSIIFAGNPNFEIVLSKAKFSQADFWGVDERTILFTQTLNKA
jgi:hypothetical protein